MLLVLVLTALVQLSGCKASGDAEAQRNLWCLPAESCFVVLEQPFPPSCTCAGLTLTKSNIPTR